MNIFTTDHPIDSQPNERGLVPFFLQAFGAAILLFIMLFCIWYWAALTTNEDVPDPSWTDYIWAVIGFIMAVPASFLVPDGTDVTIKLAIFVLGADSLFWAFVGVSSYRMFRRLARRRRLR